jgi:hypothetical protein
VGRRQNGRGGSTRTTLWRAATGRRHSLPLSAAVLERRSHAHARLCGAHCRSLPARSPGHPGAQPRWWPCERHRVFTAEQTPPPSTARCSRRAGRSRGPSAPS